MPFCCITVDLVANRVSSPGVNLKVGGDPVFTATRVLADGLVDQVALQVRGTARAESMEGNAAADTLIGGGGADSISAGAGNDAVVMDADGPTGNDTIDGGLGLNTLDFGGAAGLELVHQRGPRRAVGGGVR